MKRIFFELRYLLGDVPWDTGVSPPELLDFLDRHPPGRALDLGCGTGTNALTLAERGWEVTAIDFSAPALRAACRRLALAGKAAVVARGDVAEMAAASGPYDLVLDIGCFHSLEPQRRATYARSLRRHVGRGSTYLLVCLPHRQASAFRPGALAIPRRDRVLVHGLHAPELLHGRV